MATVQIRPTAPPPHSLYPTRPPPPETATETMSPTSISPGSIQVILQYISPPSQLSYPLPPYLLSKALLQRHHFLSISPDDPVEYLSWPSADSSESSRAIQLLETLHRLNEDDTSAYTIRYTSDNEDTFAHVNVPSSTQDGIRLVFKWDEHEAWKFHDTKLMPFPSNSQSSLRDVLVAAESNGDISIPVPTQGYNGYGSNGEHGDNDNDDDYWNAYGGQDDDSPARHLGQPTKDTANDSEDAYWAQYSSVHGTADSTVPTPPVPRRHPNPYDEPTMDHESHDFAHMGGEILPIPHSFIGARPPASSKYDPASPEDLARLLSEISPRRSPLQLASDFDDIEPELSPTETSDDSSDNTSPPESLLGLTAGLLEPTPLFLNTEQHILIQDEGSQAVTAVEDANEPLRQSIKGLYALWKVTKGNQGLTSDKEDKDAFLRIVQDVVSA